jgi:hypothetical protein
MKKIIIALSALLLVAIVVIKVANAQNTPQDVKKVQTEAKMDCSKCPSTSACSKMAGPGKCDMKTCDPAKCKEGKCDTAKCKAGCEKMKSNMKNCDPSKCSGMNKK